MQTIKVVKKYICYIIVLEEELNFKLVSKWLHKNSKLYEYQLF